MSTNTDGWFGIELVIYAALGFAGLIVTLAAFYVLAGVLPIVPALLVVAGVYFGPRLITSAAVTAASAVAARKGG